MFQVVFEFSLMILLLLLVGSQVIIPMVKGGPYFPILRKDYKKVQEELTEAQAEVQKATMEVEIKETEEHAASLRQEPPAAKPKRKTTRRRV